MMKGNFINTYRPVKFIALFFLLVQSCNNSDNAAKKTTENTADSITTTESTTPITTPHNGAASSRPGDIEKEERQQMILTQIDSTYTAISLLDDAKNEMTELSPAELSTAERNKKSKAIFNINILQNELTRALDASILANLRLRTDELAAITVEMEKNVAHLQTVTVKLNKATQCIGRLTNILALGLSKGILKPFTPRNSTAAEVKAGVSN